MDASSRMPNEIHLDRSDIITVLGPSVPISTADPNCRTKKEVEQIRLDRFDKVAVLRPSVPISTADPNCG